MHLITNKRIIAEIINGEEIIMTIDGNMLYCEFGALDRGNITDVLDFGIYVNRGSFSFIDNIGYFNNKNVNSVEIKNYTVKFYLAKTENSLIATFNIESAVFIEQTREVNIELIGKNSRLEKENTVGNIYPFYQTSTIELLDSVNEKIPNYKISLGKDLENLNNTYIGCPYIGVDTVRNVANKLCQATMSRIVETEDGKCAITSPFPERKPIIVNPYNIIDIVPAGFVRIENARIDVTNRTIYSESVLDGSKKYFSARSNQDGSFSTIEDFVITNSYREQVDANTSRYYIDANVSIKTPYKLFYIMTDSSITDYRYQSYANDQITSYVEYPRNGSVISYSNIKNESEISATIERFMVEELTIDPEVSYSQEVVKGVEIRVPVATFIDDGKETITMNNNPHTEEVYSNDLIQDKSYRTIYSSEDNTEINVGLGKYILGEINKRYSKGIECFEIECLFNDYYYEDGSVAFNGRDISNHFEKYDIIIPYVKKNGVIVPFRENDDGTPKKFRIIGISYSYDGLLRQRLSVHEERYDVD